MLKKSGFAAIELIMLITILVGIAAATKLALEVQNLQKYAMVDPGGGGGTYVPYNPPPPNNPPGDNTRNCDKANCGANERCVATKEGGYCVAINPTINNNPPVEDNTANCDNVICGIGYRCQPTKYGGTCVKVNDTPKPTSVYVNATIHQTNTCKVGIIDQDGNCVLTDVFVAFDNNCRGFQGCPPGIPIVIPTPKTVNNTSNLFSDLISGWLGWIGGNVPNWIGFGGTTSIPAGNPANMPPGCELMSNDRCVAWNLKCKCNKSSGKWENNGGTCDVSGEPCADIFPTIPSSGSPHNASIVAQIKNDCSNQQWCINVYGACQIKNNVIPSCNPNHVCEGTNEPCTQNAQNIVTLPPDGFTCPPNLNYCQNSLGFCDDVEDPISHEMIPGACGTIGQYIVCSNDGGGCTSAAPTSVAASQPTSVPTPIPTIVYSILNQFQNTCDAIRWPIPGPDNNCPSDMVDGGDTGWFGMQRCCQYENTRKNDGSNYCNSPHDFSEGSETLFLDSPNNDWYCADAPANSADTTMDAYFNYYYTGPTGLDDVVIFDTCPNVIKEERKDANGNVYYVNKASTGECFVPYSTNYK